MRSLPREIPARAGPIPAAASATRRVDSAKRGYLISPSDARLSSRLKPAKKSGGNVIYKVLPRERPQKANPPRWHPSGRRYPGPGHGLSRLARWRGLPRICVEPGSSRPTAWPWLCPFSACPLALSPSRFPPRSPVPTDRRAWPMTCRPRCLSSRRAKRQLRPLHSENIFRRPEPHQRRSPDAKEENPRQYWAGASEICRNVSRNRAGIGPKRTSNAGFY
jgi:hypothetical protein